MGRSQPEPMGPSLRRVGMHGKSEFTHLDLLNRITFAEPRLHSGSSLSSSRPFESNCNPWKIRLAYAIRAKRVVFFRPNLLYGPDHLR
jgi:hypothetical protein